MWHPGFSYTLLDAIMCVGNWSLLGLVKDAGVLAVSTLPDVEGDDDVKLDDGWDSID